MASDAEDYRFAKILTAMARERGIGLLEACAALLAEHPEYDPADEAACRRTAAEMQKHRNAETVKHHDRGTGDGVAGLVCTKDNLRCPAAGGPGES